MSTTTDRPDRSAAAPESARRCDQDFDSKSKSVLGRASLILGAFDEDHTVLTLNELTCRTRLPKSTVHRFAEQLVELGWLERRSAGYCIGMWMFEVGGLVQSRNWLRDHALPHIHELAQQTRLAVHLGVRDEHEVVYLETVPGRCSRMPTRQGGRMPTYCTGLGKAMVAWAGDDQVEATIDNGLFARTPYTIVLPDVFRAEMIEIREQGVAMDREEAFPGIACVAAPLRGSGRAIGAVSVSGPIHQFDQMVPAVRRTAQQIWHDLFG